MPRASVAYGCFPMCRGGIEVVGSKLVMRSYDLVSTVEIIRLGDIT